ncbi:MAG: hypothetical protein QMB63_08920 [Clostridiaceae bacterium]
MNAIISLAFVFVVFSIGDIISEKTNSIVSMLFTCSVIFLVGFWMGVPTTLFSDAQLLGIGALLITSLLTHMGTMLNLQQLKEQWKTVIVALAAIVGITLLLLTVGSMLIGQRAAMVSAPPIAGGIIAGIKMAEVGEKLGDQTMVVLATLLVVVQGFVGYPLASWALRKEAKVHLANKGKNPEDVVTAAQAEAKKAAEKPAFLAKYKSDNILLAKTVLVALAATYISSLVTGLKVPILTSIFDKNILALLFGVVAAQVGFLERQVLTKANSFGFTMAALMAVIFNNLSKATPQIVMQLLPTIVGALAVGTVGIIVASIIAAKVLKISPYIAIGIGSSALFGFPGTFIVSNEVSRSISNDPEDQKYVLDFILPKMLVAGFITVSIASVVLASLVAPYIH